jgi:hypothetical protein
MGISNEEMQNQRNSSRCLVFSNFRCVQVISRIVVLWALYALLLTMNKQRIFYYLELSETFKEALLS